MPYWLNPTYISLPRDFARARAFEAANAPQLRPGAGFRRLAGTEGKDLAIPPGCRCTIRPESGDAGLRMFGRGRGSAATAGAILPFSARSLRTIRGRALTTRTA
jgi:hypothetical protein